MIQNFDLKAEIQKYQFKHSLLLEVLVNNEKKIQPQTFLDLIQNYNNSQIDDLKFIKEYNQYLYKNELSIQDSYIVYNEVIHKNFDKIELQIRKIIDLLSLIHQQLNLKIKQLEQYEEVYIILDDEKVGYLCEDQVLFLFFSLFLIEKPIEQNIDIYACFKSFWLGIQQYNKVSFRTFKQFLFKQHYNSDIIIQNLNRILTMFELERVPNIRMDILKYLAAKYHYDNIIEIAVELLIKLPIEYANVEKINKENEENIFISSFIKLYHLAIIKEIQTMFYGRVNLITNH
ncbi:unnamed protein product (macronuclear) [Paramecium tetraurelia]|uniref:Uncharacterized protein n=1 Tax=Paramecium tetraurelia TaxID=5888 RepID=A0C3B8_PARTE|nr:uncharacterized protein GSPATT00034764001 [Paramecium tetraurelia]CAK65285.1 unnamed protein product [Paramecium tetraurelia]|eukprot:XP_001432682.1 hypothetical protein (macronuclear) [Paramecium tetraurelia strain d4-2]